MTATQEALPIDAVPAGVPPQAPFAPLREVLERWFYKPDLQAIRIVLGTIKSHYLNLGDPAWLFAVALLVRAKLASASLAHRDYPKYRCSETSVKTHS